MNEFNPNNSKSIRTLAMLTCSSLPSTPRMGESEFEKLILAFHDVEKNKAPSGTFRAFAVAVSRLMDTLKKENIHHNFSAKDLFIWASLELIETDVDMDEISKWMNHGPTIEEIFFSEDRGSIISLIKKGEVARERYQQLLKELLYG